MKIFLDENFPLGLVPDLTAERHQVDHVITIGWRGAPDDRIRERLVDSDLLFLTQDEDFLFARGPAAMILVSRVRQARPLRERIDIWIRAVRELTQNPQTERRFELLDDGTLIAWEEASDNSWIAKAPRQPDARTDDRG